MKKFTSFFIITLLSSMLFAATFKNGQTVYILKDGTLTSTEKSSAKAGSVSKGDVAVVIASNSKKTNIKIASLGISGWIDNSSLTKKKVLKETVTTSVDNIALAGKGKKSAKTAKTETAKTSCKKAAKTEEVKTEEPEIEEVKLEQVKIEGTESEVKTEEVKE